MRSLRQGAVDGQAGQLLTQAFFKDLASEHPEDPRQARIQLTQGTRVHILYQGRQGREGLMQGVVKVYDAATGVGIIVRDDDRSEVLLKPGSLEGSMFRFLRQGQRVRFDQVGEGKDAQAENLRFGSDGY
jgi:CspA family cold shock protein